MTLVARLEIFVMIELGEYICPEESQQDATDDVLIGKEGHGLGSGALLLHVPSIPRGQWEETCSSCARTGSRGVAGALQGGAPVRFHFLMRLDYSHALQRSGPKRPCARTQYCTTPRPWTQQRKPVGHLPFSPMHPLRLTASLHFPFLPSTAQSFMASICF